MNEQTINNVVEKLIHYASSAELFTSKNIPLYIDELLRYHFIMAVVKLSILIILLMLFSYLSYSTIKTARRVHKIDDLKMILLFVSGLIFIISIFAIPINISTIIKIKSAPRVYVVDYLRSMK